MSPTTPADALQRLLADHSRHERAVAGAYHDGFRQGFNDGQEVGYGRRCHEEAQEWKALAAQVRTVANQPTAPELERRRNEPGGPAYLARLARHGIEYSGGPVQWETGIPLRRTA